MCPTGTCSLLHAARTQSIHFMQLKYRILPELDPAPGCSLCHAQFIAATWAYISLYSYYHTAAYIYSLCIPAYQATCLRHTSCALPHIDHGHVHIWLPLCFVPAAHL